MPERQTIHIPGHHRSARALAVRDATMQVQATNAAAMDFQWEGYVSGEGTSHDGYHKVSYIVQGT